MRWIADVDKQSIETARGIVSELAATGSVDALEALAHLNGVLENMKRLERSADTTNTLKLSPSDRLTAYPERYRRDLTPSGHCPACSRLPVLCKCPKLVMGLYPDSSPLGVLAVGQTFGVQQVCSKAKLVLA